MSRLRNDDINELCQELEFIIVYHKHLFKESDLYQ